MLIPRQQGNNRGSCVCLYQIAGEQNMWPSMTLSSSFYKLQIEGWVQLTGRMLAQQAQSPRFSLQHHIKMDGMVQICEEEIRSSRPSLATQVSQRPRETLVLQLPILTAKPRVTLLHFQHTVPSRYTGACQMARIYPTKEPASLLHSQMICLSFVLGYIVLLHL